jgi:hypothetical protein
MGAAVGVGFCSPCLTHVPTIPAGAWFQLMNETSCVDRIISRFILYKLLDRDIRTRQITPAIFHNLPLTPYSLSGTNWTILSGETVGWLCSEKGKHACDMAYGIKHFYCL